MTQNDDFLTEIVIASALQEEKWPRADEIRCFSYDYGLGGIKYQMQPPRFLH